MVLEGLHLPKPPDSWMALSPTEGSRCFCIKSRQPTGCRLSLVSVSESDSQKSVSQKLKIKILQTKKFNKNGKLFLHAFQNLGLHVALQNRVNPSIPQCRDYELSEAWATKASSGPARESPPACIYENHQKLIKSLKMFLETSDKNKFYYFYVLNPFIKLT